MHRSVRFQVSTVLVEHDIILVVLVLRRASLLIMDVGCSHQLLVDIPEVKFLSLTVIHQQQIIQLRWLIAIEGHLFILALVHEIDLVGSPHGNSSS